MDYSKIIHKIMIKYYCYEVLVDQCFLMFRQERIFCEVVVNHVQYQNLSLNNERLSRWKIIISWDSDVSFIKCELVGFE